MSAYKTPAALKILSVVVLLVVIAASVNALLVVTAMNMQRSLVSHGIVRTDDVEVRVTFMTHDLLNVSFTAFLEMKWTVFIHDLTVNNVSIWHPFVTDEGFHVGTPSWDVFNFTWSNDTQYKLDVYYWLGTHPHDVDSAPDQTVSYVSGTIVSSPSQNEPGQVSTAPLPTLNSTVFSNLVNVTTEYNLTLSAYLSDGQVFLRAVLNCTGPVSNEEIAFFQATDNGVLLIGLVMTNEAGVATLTAQTEANGNFLYFAVCKLGGQGTP